MYIKIERTFPSSPLIPRVYLYVSGMGDPSEMLSVGIGNQQTVLMNPFTDMSLVPRNQLSTNLRLPTPVGLRPHLFTQGFLPRNLPAGAHALPASYTKWQCPMCGKLCNGRHALRHHIFTHTGEKPYKCDVCGKAFSTKGNKRAHMFSVHQTAMDESRG